MSERSISHLNKHDVFNAGGRLVYGDNYEQLYAQVSDGQCLAGLTNLDGELVFLRDYYKYKLYVHDCKIVQASYEFYVMPEDAAMSEYGAPKYKVINVPTEIGRLLWLDGDEWRTTSKVKYKITDVPTEIGPLSRLDGDKWRTTSNDESSDESNDESDAETIKNANP